MNDTPLDLDALASALLDDEATVDERARLEADVELRQAVHERLERLRSVRALLGDVEPAPISTREAHLAAALAAWDRIPDAERTGALRDVTPRDVDAATVAAAASLTSPSRGRGRGGQRSNRWLTAAAAVVAVVAVGGIVVRFAGDTGSDDGGTDADSAEVAGEELTESPAVAGELRAEVADAGDGSVSDEASRSGAAEDAADAAATAAPDASISTGINDAAPPAEDALVLLESAEDLVDFAAPALAATPVEAGPAATSALVDDDSAPVPTMPDCAALDLIVGPAVYRDTTVLVGIDANRRLVIAVRIDDCVTVATARL